MPRLPKPPTRVRSAEVEEAAPEAPAAADTGDAITEDVGGVPAHLLERARKRKAALAGDGGGNGDAGAAAPAAAGGAAGAAPGARPRLLSHRRPRERDRVVTRSGC